MNTNAVFRSEGINYKGYCKLTGNICDPLSDCRKCFVPFWPKEIFDRLKESP